jgi:adenosine deaminase
VVAASLGFSLDEVKALTFQAAEASFLPDDEKLALIAQFETELAKVH